MPTQLAPMRGTSGGSDAVLQAFIDDATQRIVSQVLPMFTDAFQLLVQKLNAQIVVPPSQVVNHHIPPAVTNAPVTVNVPELEQPEVNVTISMESLAAQLSQTNALLARLLELSEKSVTRTVTRDKNGQITEIKEVRI